HPDVQLRPGAGVEVKDCPVAIEGKGSDKNQQRGQEEGNAAQRKKAPEQPREEDSHPPPHTRSSMPLPLAGGAKRIKALRLPRGPSRRWPHVPSARRAARPGQRSG